MRLVLTVVVAAGAVLLAWASALHSQTQPSTAPAASQPADWAVSAMRELKLSPSVEPLTIPADAGERAVGAVNWTSGQVLAVGQAKLKAATGQQLEMAMRGARLLAARNAVLLAGGLRVGPGGKVEGVRDANVDVEATLKDFREVSSDYDHVTNSAVVKLQAPLYGAKGVIRLSAPAAGQKGASFAWPARGEAAHTLVVVDARGTAARPCAMPRLVDSHAAVLLSAADLPAGQLGRRSMVVWASGSPDGAVAGTLVVAAKADAKSPGELVLDDAAVARLAQSANARDLLREGKVIVITGDR
jgi:hypothetical protein